MLWKKMTARMHGDVVIVDLEGNMCLCGECELPALVSGLLEQGVRKFILNLRELPYIDSAGLAGVVRATTMVRRRAGTLVLLCPHQRIRALLDVVKFAPALEVFDSEDDALRSLGGTVTTTGT